MIKRLSRGLFPQKVGLFLIFCLEEGISEDLKIWHILFRQGLGKSRGRAGSVGEHRIPPPLSWPSCPAGSEGHSSTAAGISSQESPAQQASCSGVKGNIFPSLNKLLSHYHRNEPSPKDFLKQTKLLGIYERHHPAPTAFTSPVVCTLRI